MKIKLCKIISKGINYRKPKTIIWRKSKESMAEGLGNLIKGKLLSEKKIFEKSLILWKPVILTKVDKKYESLKLELNHLNSILI